MPGSDVLAPTKTRDDLAHAGAVGQHVRALGELRAGDGDHRGGREQHAKDGPERHRREIEEHAGSDPGLMPVRYCLGARDCRWGSTEWSHG